MTQKHKRDKVPQRKKVDQQIPISQIRPIKLLGPRYYLQHAREYPIFGCWVQEDWEESGLTPVVVARQQSSDKVLFCLCLVDTLCLGVKDALTDADISQKKFVRELPLMCNGAPKKCTVEFAHELIYGAIEFAARYGFQPHPDFSNQFASLVLDPSDAYPHGHKIKFGRKGKPLYIAGPHEDRQKINQILSTLMRTAGEGKFDYIVGFE